MGHCQGPSGSAKLSFYGMAGQDDLSKGVCSFIYPGVPQLGVWYALENMNIRSGPFPREAYLRFYFAYNFRGFLDPKLRISAVEDP